MNYLEFKNRVLDLLNQRTIAGNDVALSYNNQADYVLRIPGLLDSAQKALATTVKRIYAEFPLDWDAAEQRNGFYIFTMPADFFEMVGRGIPVMCNGEFKMYHRYRWMGRNKLVIPAADKADMVVHYHRYPEVVPAKPADDFMLDNEPDAQDAAVYYVASNLVVHDNAFLAAQFYNEYETRRVQMVERPQTEFESIEDLYGNPGDGLYGV